MGQQYVGAVKFQLLDSVGNPDGPVFDLGTAAATGSGLSFGPTAAMWDGNNFHAVWLDGLELRAAKVDVTAGTASTPSTVAHNVLAPFRLAWVWQEPQHSSVLAYTTTDNFVKLQLLSANDVPTAGPIVVAAGIGPSVAWNGARLGVAWTGAAPDRRWVPNVVDKAYGVYFALYQPQKSGVASTVTPLSTGVQWDLSPSVAWGQGRFVVAWYHNTGSSARNEVRLALLGADGKPEGTWSRIAAGSMPILSAGSNELGMLWTADVQSRLYCIEGWYFSRLDQHYRQIGSPVRVASSGSSHNSAALAGGSSSFFVTAIRQLWQRQPWNEQGLACQDMTTGVY